MNLWAHGSGSTFRSRSSIGPSPVSCRAQTLFSGTVLIAIIIVFGGSTRFVNTSDQHL